jgi:ankyrin repeat protein
MKKSGVLSLKVVVFTCCCVIWSNAAFSSVAGVYIHEGNMKEYLVLYENGTCYVNADDGIFGQYTVDGSVITLTLANEDPESGLIEGDVITGPDGSELVKYVIPATPDDARKALEQMKIDYTENAFREHAKDGDLIAVELFLNTGMDVNAKGKDGETALMLAAYKDGSAVVQVLLDNGDEVNAKDEDGITALMAAAYEGKSVIAQMLIDKGADVNIQNEDGETALMIGASTYREYLTVIQVLLDNGAEVNTKDEDGETALMKASARGHLAIVQRLLDKGAEVNAEDEDERNALTHAAEKGHDVIIQLLKQAGATEDDTHRRLVTAARMRSLGTALGSYQVDHNVFPIAEQSTVSAITFKDDPKDGLTKDYYDGPTTDAWGTEFYYSSASDGQGYTLKSWGKDTVEGSGTGELDSDIVYINGQFVAPEAILKW